MYMHRIYFETEDGSKTPVRSRGAFSPFTRMTKSRRRIPCGSLARLWMNWTSGCWVLPGSSRRQRGRPPYSVRTLLKLYLYGHTNRIRSSRMLERGSLSQSFTLDIDPDNIPDPQKSEGDCLSQGLHPANGGAQGDHHHRHRPRPGHHHAPPFPHHHAAGGGYLNSNTPPHRAGAYFLCIP